MATTYDKASLVMIPSGYKDDKLYSVKPTDGSGDFTFSRDGSGASPATRVNASGYIEKGRTNSYTYSQDFSNAIWSKARGSVTTNVISAPDGTTTADLFTEDTSTGTHDIRQGLTTTSGGFYMFSIYVKANGRNVLDVYVGGANKSANFNLTTGSVTGGTAAIRKIEDAGGGWYRVSVGVLAASTTTTAIWILNNGSTQSYTGDGVSGMYFWGAQAEQSLVATDYIETTTTAVSAGLLGDMPRLDYSGGATCPSLLLEPSRVNHYYQSEYFSTGSRVVFTPNAITSPEGVSNGTSVVATSVNGSHEVTLSPLISIANTNPRTFSLYAKYNGNHLILNVAGSSTAWTACVFDLENGVAKTPQNNGSQSVCTADIEDAGNGWYRCSITYTPYASGGFLHLISLTDDVDATLTTWGADSYIGDDVSGIYIYGAQVEQGSYPTSYIPTYGSAASRAVEVPVKSSVSSLIGQTEGTLFFDWIMNHESPNTSEDLYSLTLSDGTNNNLIGINNYNNTLVAFIKVTTLQFFDNSYTGGADGARIKLALAYANNDIALYINGTQIATDSSATIPALSEIRLNSYWSGNLVDSTSVNQLVLFKTRLTNAELAALTTI